MTSCSLGSTAAHPRLASAASRASSVRPSSEVEIGELSRGVRRGWVTLRGALVSRASSSTAATSVSPSCICAMSGKRPVASGRLGRRARPQPSSTGRACSHVPAAGSRSRPASQTASARIEFEQGGRRRRQRFHRVAGATDVSSKEATSGDSEWGRCSGSRQEAPRLRSERGCAVVSGSYQTRPLGRVHRTRQCSRTDQPRSAACPQAESLPMSAESNTVIEHGLNARQSDWRTSRASRMLRALIDATRDCLIAGRGRCSRRAE